MLRAQKTRSRLRAAGLRFGVVTACYNADLATGLLVHCLDTLTQAGARARDVKVVPVPGSFEVSVVAARLARSRRYDCVIGLGVILKGETSHAQHIADAVAHGLTQIAITTGVPTIFGIVTANNLRQARMRCLGRKHNRGREAAETAIQMAWISKHA